MPLMQLHLMAMVMSWGYGVPVYNLPRRLPASRVSEGAPRLVTDILGPIVVASQRLPVHLCLLKKKLWLIFGQIITRCSAQVNYQIPL